MSQRNTGQRQAQQAYIPAQYPLMSLAEITSILDVLGITVSPEELSKPHAQVVQMIYTALLDALMGAPAEMIEGPKTALLGMMEHKVGWRSVRRIGKLGGWSFVEL